VPKLLLDLLGALVLTPRLVGAWLDITQGDRISHHRLKKQPRVVGRFPAQ